jgi:hypothetical protein
MTRLIVLLVGVSLTVMAMGCADESGEPCNTGAKRCADLRVEVCSESGEWELFEFCDRDDSATNGACVFFERTDPDDVNSISFVDCSIPNN